MDVLSILRKAGEMGMTKEEAYRYIDNLKWLKGYDNTTIGGKSVGEILDEIEAMLKEQEAVKIEVKKINDSGRCGRCPNCFMELNETDYPKLCGYCGQKVKWND